NPPRRPSPVMTSRGYKPSPSMACTSGGSAPARYSGIAWLSLKAQRDASLKGVAVVMASTQCEGLQLGIDRRVGHVVGVVPPRGQADPENPFQHIGLAVTGFEEGGQFGIA